MILGPIVSVFQFPGSRGVRVDTFFECVVERQGPIRFFYAYVFHKIELARVARERAVGPPLNYRRSWTC